MTKWIAMLLALAASGCAITDKSGTTHHCIIGFGIVSVRADSDISVVKSTAVGINVSSGKCTLGYGSNLSVAVNTNANALIEVSQKPGKPLIIKVQ